MKIKNTYLLFLLLILLGTACGNENDPAPGTGTSTAEAVFETTSLTCSSYGIGGTYSINEALTSSHSVGVSINVTKTGTYTISTNTVNGYSFSGSGKFTKTGVQNVIMAGSGKPLVSGTDTFTVSFGTSSCNFSNFVKDLTDYSSRIIIATGQVFMADNYTVYAFDGNKKILWTKTGFSGIPTIRNGVAYLTIGGYMQAVNVLTGAQLWANTTIGNFETAVTFYDSTLYSSGSDGYIYSIHAKDGTLNWKYFTGSYGVISSAPTVVNGVVYVGGNGGKIFALNTNGTEKWAHQLTGVTSAVRSSPAVDGTLLYAGNDNGFLYALNLSDGSEAWSYNVGISGEQSPTIKDGKIYIQGNLKLLCLNSSNGAFVWEYKLSSDADWSSPCVSNGIVYASGMGNGLQAFDALTGQLLWSNSSSAQTADGDPVVFNGLVYITGPGGISAVNAKSGAKLWNYGYLDPSNTSASADFYTSPVVYDKITKAVAYPSTSGNTQ